MTTLEAIARQLPEYGTTVSAMAGFSDQTISEILTHYYALNVIDSKWEFGEAVEDALDVLHITVPDRTFWALVRRVEAEHERRVRIAKKQSKHPFNRRRY